MKINYSIRNMIIINLLIISITIIFAIITSIGFGVSDYTVEYNDLITHNVHRYHNLVYPEYDIKNTMDFETDKYDFWFNTWSKTFNLPDGLLKAVALHESTVKKSATNLNKNGTIDYGIMQLNSAYIESYLNDLNWEWEWDWEQPRDNIMLGAFILSQNLKYYDGDINKALSAYNTGIGGTNKNGIYWTYINKIEWSEN